MEMRLICGIPTQYLCGKINDKGFMNSMNEAIKSQHYEIDTIQILKQCPVKIDKDRIYIIEAGKECLTNTEGVPRIAEARDSGSRFYIVNDLLCKNYGLRRYPNPRRIEDFAIEKMSNQGFCEKWDQ